MLQLFFHLNFLSFYHLDRKSVPEGLKYENIQLII